VYVLLGERPGSGDGEVKAMNTKQNVNEPLPASDLFSLRFGRWLGSVMDLLANNSSAYRWWWAWCAVARLKTFAVFLIMRKQWRSSWSGACKMYNASSCRRSWAENPHEYRARTSGIALSHQVAAAQSKEEKHTCIDCSPKDQQSEPLQSAQPDLHRQELPPKPSSAANPEEDLSLLSRGQEPPSQVETPRKNQSPSREVVSGWENASGQAHEE
jgi:hypothetical protein